MNYDDAAWKLGISRAEVIRMCIDGELDVEHVGRDRQVRINAEQVDRKRGAK